MADFSYDINELTTAKKAVDELVDALNTSHKDLNTKLGDLKKGWDTDAGKKFFEQHTDTWTEYVKKYTKKLEGVSKMLQKAIDEYNDVEDKVKNLSV